MSEAKTYGTAYMRSAHGVTCPYILMDIGSPIPIVAWSMSNSFEGSGSDDDLLTIVVRQSHFKWLAPEQADEIR